METAPDTHSREGGQAGTQRPQRPTVVVNSSGGSGIGRSGGKSASLTGESSSQEAHDAKQSSHHTCPAGKSSANKQPSPPSGERSEPPSLLQGVLQPLMDSNNEALKGILDETMLLCDECLHHFVHKTDNESGKHLISVIHAVKQHLATVVRHALALSTSCESNDADATHHGNGYRSLLAVTTSCLRKLSKKFRKILDARNSFFVRWDAHIAYLESYKDILEVLCQILSFATRLQKASGGGLIFMTSEEESASWVSEANEMVTTCFFAKRFGFQYPPLMRSILKTVLIANASFSESCLDHEYLFVQSAFAAIHSAKYLISPEKRAKQLAEQHARKDIKFLKRFWNLTETTVAQNFPKIIAPSMAINHVFWLSTAPLWLPATRRRRRGFPLNFDDDELCTPHTPLPSPLLSPLLSPQTEHRTSVGDFVMVDEAEKDFAFIGDQDLREGRVMVPFVPSAPNPSTLKIPVRLMSATHREGQNQVLQLFGPDGTATPLHSLGGLVLGKAAPATGLVVHFHGGGFVAHSSASHEPYLREWAKVLNVPILSVDYSLAPEARYPQALEECFYAYAWALDNAARLGTTANRVVLAGDSAGGNLCAAVAFKAIEAGIRVPDALCMAYPALYLALAPSPSRMLALMDPMLAMPALQLCLDAYAPQGTQPRTDPFLSPAIASDDLLSQLPPVYLMASTLDPLLDDSITFARRLRALDHPLELELIESLPHGFLNFCVAGGAPMAACMAFCDFIRRALCPSDDVIARRAGEKVMTEASPGAWYWEAD